MTNLAEFQPTRPLRGATAMRGTTGRRLSISTHAPLAGRDEGAVRHPRHRRISTHAPLAGRDRHKDGRCGVVPISTHAPLAGRDARRWRRQLPSLHFNPRAPCGARPSPCSRSGDITEKISTHAPLAGRDSKSVQITMHIFAITDKFQMLLHRMPPVRAFCSFLMQENHADFGCEPPK